MSPLITYIVILALAVFSAWLVRWATAVSHDIDEAVEEALSAPSPVDLGCTCRSCNDARDLIGLDDWLVSLTGGEQR